SPVPQDFPASQWALCRSDLKSPFAWARRRPGSPDTAVFFPVCFLYFPHILYALFLYASSSYASLSSGASHSRSAAAHREYTYIIVSPLLYHKNGGLANLRLNGVLPRPAFSLFFCYFIKSNRLSCLGAKVFFPPV